MGVSSSYHIRNDSLVHDVVEMAHPQLGTIKMPGIAPVFSETPGEIKWRVRCSQR
jgi:hypothetical protein